MNRKFVLLTIVVSFFVSTLIGCAAGFLGGYLLPRLFPQLNLTKIFPQSIEKEIETLPFFPSTTGPSTSSQPATSSEKSFLTEEEATIEAVKKVSKAVVSISITKEIIREKVEFPFDEFFFGTPFWQETPQPKKQESIKEEVGGGTGFIISSDGLILTNKHVVNDEKASYQVITNDNQFYPAKVLAVDPFLDLAILKIEAKNLPTVTLGNSDQIQIGQTVIAIGNTLSEYRNTVTKGVISGINRRVVAGGGLTNISEVIEGAIQTDAAINPGNSGGPLINLKGEVIGINTAISQAGQSIGFAIPINLAKPVIESVKKYGRIIRPWIGVRYILINKKIAEENKLPVDYGALITRGEKSTDLAVIPGSPADKAGLQENDIILEVNGLKVSENKPLSFLIQKQKPGDKVKLKILRKGETKIIEVVLGEYKP